MCYFSSTSFSLDYSGTMTDPPGGLPNKALGAKTLMVLNTSIPLGRPQITWDSSARCDGVPYVFHVVVGIFVSCLALLAVIGNFLVLMTYARHNRLRTSSNLLIVNLTVADLIMAALDLPILAMACFKGCWMLGFVGCQVYGLSSAIAGLVTINTLAAISLDRYVVVVRRLSPTHQLGKSTTGCLILLVWVASLIWAFIPLAVNSSYRLEGMGTSCTFDYVTRTSSNRWFFLGLVTFNFFLPLSVIIGSYYKIFSSVRQVKRELQLLQTTESFRLKKRVKIQAEIKTAVTAMIIIVVFCTAWTPYVTIAFVGLFGTEGVITPLVSMFPNILAKLSTVSNPILYSLGHPEVRKLMKKCFFSHVPETFSTTWRQTSAGAHSISPPESNDSPEDMTLQPTVL